MKAGIQEKHEQSGYAKEKKGSDFAKKTPLSEYLKKQTETVLADGRDHINALYKDAAELWKEKAAKADGKPVFYFIATFDCARVNMKNSLLTRNGGDACIAAFIDTQTAAAKATFCDSQNNGIDMFNIRVSQYSDETATHAAGNAISPYTAKVFTENLAAAKERIYRERENYKFEVVVGEGKEAKKLKLNLHAASIVFKHPEVVTAYNMKGPVVERVLPKEQNDFIKEKIKTMEGEKPWMHALPRDLRFESGRVDIHTELDDASAEELKNGGVVIQLKYALKDQKHIKSLFRILNDGWDGNGAKGLRKCYSAIISNSYALTGLNTIWGNAFGNALTSAGLHGVERFKEDTGIVIKRIPGSYYHYHANMNISEWERYEDRLIKAILGTIQAKPTEVNEEGRIVHTPFYPQLTVIESVGKNMDELRALFALKSLGKHLPADALARADFLVNFIDNIKGSEDGTPIKEKMLEEVGISKEEMNAINIIYRYCTNYRTVRDAQDLIWVLRLNREEALERVFWQIALEKGKKLQEAFLLKIAQLVY
ncbi:MAG: hypothetical protein QW590_03210 [Candidatus Bilamarchaeaceae archaeon]